MQKHSRSFPEQSCVCNMQIILNPYAATGKVELTRSLDNRASSGVPYDLLRRTCSHLPSQFLPRSVSVVVGIGR